MSEQDLKIVSVQADLIWENPKANLQHLEKWILADNREVDVIVLPEMFATGFTMNPQQFAAVENGIELQWLRKIAQTKNAAIVGSLSFCADDKFYNRLFWVNPDGKIFQYDKRHLFSFAKEDSQYTAGSERIIIEYKGWKICPLVCYDLRFPVWSRNDKNNPYDVLIYVANFPQSRTHAWTSLLIARAIENQSYVIGVNRVGNDGNNIYHSGDSMIIDPVGAVLQHSEGKEALLYQSLGKENLVKMRRYLPFLKDADEYKIVSGQ